MAKLAENHYGKSRVRLVKVTREGDTHDVREWTVGVYLTGDFTACYVAGDNTGLLATDTMKNTVYAVARSSAAKTQEDFALELAAFLLGRNPPVTSVRIEIAEKPWIRMKIRMKTTGAVAKHGSTFMQRGPEVHTCTVVLTPGAPAAVTSGVDGLVILKTSHSAFFGFKRDELTSLPDAQDRLLGTAATIDWMYAEPPADFAAARALMMETLLETFAAHDSLSVQHTLYAMAEAGLAALPEVAEMTLTMPNRHNIPVDLGKFGMDNPNEIFVPQDEPHGLIVARVVR